MARKVNVLRLSLFAGALLLLLVLLILLVVKCSGPSASASKASLEETDLIAEQSAIPFKDGYVTSNGVYIRAYTGAKQLLWEYAPDSSDVSYSASDSLVALWKNEGVVILGDEGTVLYSVRLEGQIEKVRCGTNDFAVSLVGGSEVYVYSYDGTLIDTLKLDGLEILDFGFYTQEDLCYVMALDVDGTIPVSYFNTYQPGKLSTGSHTFSDQIVYKALFSGSTTYMITSRYVRVASDAESEILVYGWQYLDSAQTQDGFAIAFTRTSQINAPSEIKVLMGTSEFDLRFPANCLGVVAGSKYLYGIASDAIYRIAYQEGASAVKIPLNSETPLTGFVAALDGKYALVQGNNVVYRLTLPQ